MKKNLIYKLALIVSVVSLLAGILIWAVKGLEYAGPFLIAFFTLLAYGVNGYPTFKGLSFTISILGVVTLAMYYPHLFEEYNGFKLSVLILPLVQIIMFGMGTTMGVKDFVELIKHPRSVIIGTIAQFLIMPLAGFMLAKVLGFPAEIGVGLILLGCAPTSVTASLFCYLARANVALAITITSVTTLLAPFVLPFLMKLLAGGSIDIDVLSMMWSMIKIVIIPVAGGLLFNYFLSGKAKWLDAAMPLVSMLGVGLIVAIIIAAGRESLLSIGVLLLVAVMLHGILGYIFGYLFAMIFRMNKGDCRTVSICTGMQNAGLVSGIAQEMGKVATVGLAPAICGPIMGFTGSVIASYWSNKPTGLVPADTEIAIGGAEAIDR